MIFKTCTKCGESKPANLEFFHNDKSKSDSLCPSCKVCKNKQNSNRSKKHKERKKEYDKNYRAKPENKIKDNLRYSIRKTNPDYKTKQKERLKVYRAKPENKLKRKVYQQNIPKATRAKHNRDYRKRNIKKFREYTKNYYNNNKVAFSYRQMLKGFIKYYNIKKLENNHYKLGYSLKSFKLRIEYNFKSGMSWNNYGEWHIDHIKPISRFSIDVNPRIVNCLANLRPMWAFDNLSKHNK